MTATPKKTRAHSAAFMSVTNHPIAADRSLEAAGCSHGHGGELAIDLLSKSESTRCATRSSTGRTPFDSRRLLGAVFRLLRTSVLPSARFGCSCFTSSDVVSRRELESSTRTPSVRPDFFSTPKASAMSCQRAAGSCAKKAAQWDMGDLSVGSGNSFSFMLTPECGCCFALIYKRVAACSSASAHASSISWPRSMASRANSLRPWLPHTRSQSDSSTSSRKSSSVRVR